MPRWIALLLVAALVVAACGDDDDAGSGDDAAADDAPADDAGADAPTDAPTEEPTDVATEEPTEEPTPAPTEEPVPEPRLPTEVVEATGGNGIAFPLSNAPLPEGWTETEYILTGDAMRYEMLSEATPDGLWEVAEAGETAPYGTRMIVRTPPAEDFSGVVVVEWFNVTAGTDTSPDWAYTAEELERTGVAYVGVSVQAVGVNGSGEQSAANALIDTRGLADRDPERYGATTHPGDAFAFDIWSQVGAVVAASPGTVDLFGGATPTHVIAAGESQSAIFLTGYINGVHPLVRVFDGFLVHSRGAGAPDASGARNADGPAITIRTDLTEPVFIFEAETDLNVLGYHQARQDDTDTIRTWEVAGTAHSDAYSLSIATGAARDGNLGAIIGCADPINDGPHHETLQAAVRHLVAWVVDGTPPPSSPRLEVDASGDEATIVRDDLGIAIGGIRTPPVDVPLRVLSGDPPDTGGGFCFLFGRTFPLPPEELAARYPTIEEFESQLRASADEAVANGWLLPEDAEIMITEELARAETLGIGG